MKIDRVIIQTDGASRGNPGIAAIGAIIKDIQGGVLATLSRTIGTTTNNQAEYQAIIAALEEAISLGAQQVELRIDSELVVKQCNGEYRVKKAELKPLHRRVKELASRFKSFTITQVPRERNSEADGLANIALDKYRKSAGK